MTKRNLLTILSFFLIASAFSQSELIKTIYFKPGSFSIDKKYNKSLNIIAGKLSSDTFGSLKIFGYTDTEGSDRYNGMLSKKRAYAVYNYLKSQNNFDTTGVYIEWLGESNEAYDLHFPTAHIQQRCVDIWIQFSKKRDPNNPK